MQINDTNTGFKFKIPPPQLYNARVAWIIDLGTQTTKASTRPGNSYPSKQVHKIKISFELVDTNEIFKEGEAPKPFFVSTKSLTLSLKGNKNNFRDLLLSLMGRPIQPTENITQVLQSILGMACTIQVVHNPSDSDPTQIYANIQSVMPSMNANAVAPLRNPTVFFDMESPTCVAEYQKINGKSTLEKIHLSPEFQALVQQGRIVQRVIEQNQNQQAQPQQQQFNAPQQQFQQPQQQYQQAPVQQPWTPPQPQWGAQNPVQPQVQQQPVPPQPQWNAPPAPQQPVAPPAPQWNQQQQPVQNPVQPVNPFQQPQQQPVQPIQQPNPFQQPQQQQNNNFPPPPFGGNNDGMPF